MFTSETITAIRRMPLIASVAFVLVACGPPASDREVRGKAPDDASATQIPVLVGSYTGSGEDASKGLYRVRLNTATGQLGQRELIASIANPSFAAIDSANKRLYVVSETQDGQVAAYRWSTDANKLNLINSQPTEGAAPCYVALSPDGSKLAVANYTTGNIAVYDLDTDSGAIGENPILRQHTGAGANASRQEGPHAHWVQWDKQSRFLYVVDLGIDQVVGYRVDPQSGELGQGFTAFQAEAGAGPRHMAFHPHGDRVYILNELSNTIVVAEQQEDGRLMALQTLSTLPESYTEHSQAAHIAVTPAGNNLYISNRGHDSIAVFEIAEEGKLSLIQWADTGGSWPRHFTVLPDINMMLVANQHTHNIVGFDIADDGSLTANGHSVQLSQPVYLEAYSE